MPRRIAETRSAATVLEGSASAAQGLDEVLERVTEKSKTAAKPYAKIARELRTVWGDGQD